MPLFSGWWKSNKNSDTKTDDEPKKDAPTSFDTPASAPLNESSTAFTISPVSEQDQAQAAYYKNATKNSQNTDKKANKLSSDCSKESVDSLNCSLKYPETKDEVCKPFYDIYRACRKEENKKRFQNGWFS